MYLTKGEFLQKFGILPQEFEEADISWEELLEIDAVELNNAKPGRLMARHLLELGHRHVAFVSPPLTSKQGQRLKRVEGFVREFEEAGYGDGVIVKSADEDLDEVIPSMDSEYKMGYYLTKELLREDKNLTAIVGMNDMIAFGIMDAVLESKLRGGYFRSGM